MIWSLNATFFTTRFINSKRLYRKKQSFLSQTFNLTVNRLVQIKRIQLEKIVPLVKMEYLVSNKHKLGWQSLLVSKEYCRLLPLFLKLWIKRQNIAELVASCNVSSSSNLIQLIYLAFLFPLNLELLSINSQTFQ